MEFKHFTLACGAPLYVMERPYVESVAMCALVRVGARDEMLPDESGLSHAFEHIVFRGNSRFPTDKEVAAYIEETGGDCNAATFKEMTMFEALVPAVHFDRAATYLYHLLSDPLFREKDIVDEMQSVLHEIRDRNDDPSGIVQEVLENALYRDHPLAADILGTIESVSSFSRADFVRYHGKFYNSENFTFIVVGNVSAERVCDTLDNLFSSRTGRSRNVRRAVTEVNPQKLIIVPKDVEQVQICLAAPIGASSARSTAALNIFSAMIDGGMSSPLFQEVRSKRGLCYEVAAHVIGRSDVGYFRVYLATDPEHCAEAISTVKSIITSSIRNESLFLLAKQFLVGKAALLYENSSSIMSRAAIKVLLENRPSSPQETIEEIKGIEFSEVVAAAERYLVPENFVYALVAPKDFRYEP
ncbi:MAG: pitrilysin family protein [Patescibacteria group bacterium]